ncbi:unnamed protein product [Linum trigynum]|uniref:Uncharacterized protein n=1 Tax=Linum trigynum TaxID=586398 RepID=A0AAV2E3T1_9ROSI
MPHLLLRTIPTPRCAVRFGFFLGLWAEAERRQRNDAQPNRIPSSLFSKAARKTTASSAFNGDNDLHLSPPPNHGSESPSSLLYCSYGRHTSTVMTLQPREESSFQRRNLLSALQSRIHNLS